MISAAEAAEIIGVDGSGRGIVRAKWTIDGATTLAEAAQKARQFAEQLQVLHDAGYTLEGPVDDDYGHVHKS